MTDIIQNRIILILPEENPYDRSSLIEPDAKWQPGNKWCGIWFGHWADLYARDMASVDNGAYSYEIWQPDTRAEIVYEHSYSDRISHKLYPALYQNKTLQSAKMFAEMKKLTNETVIFFGVRVSFNYYLLQALTSKHVKKISLLLDYDLPMTNFLKFSFNLLFKMQTLYHHYKLKSIIDVFDKVSYSTNLNLMQIKKYTRKVFFTPTGIDFDLWTKAVEIDSIKRKYNVSKDALVLLMSCRLVASKGIDKIVETLNSIQTKRKYLLIVTGSGSKEYETELRLLTEKLSMGSQVRFTGYITDEQLFEMYQIADIFISASEWEGGPVTTVKAMALELPVLTTDIGLSAEILKKNNCGLFIPCKFDSVEWKNKLEFAIEHTQDIPVMKRDAVRNIYDNKIVAKNILKEIERIKK